MEPRSFHILVVLAAGPRHGYAIRLDVEERTGGEVKLWPATLYGTLKELETHGLIQRAPSPDQTDDDARRRYYALTPTGRAALTEEAGRLDALATLARRRLELGEAS